MYYKDAGNWLPLPAWSSFFISLGGKLAKRSYENKRWTVALALPTKAYIAPFIGVGVLSSIFMKSSPNDLLEAHFQTLASLEKYTFVWYRKNKRVLKAKFLGVADFKGEQRLLIQIQSTEAGGLTEYISKKDALDVQINPNQSSRLPNNQRGRTVTTHSPLADTIFGVHSQMLLKQSETKLCFVGGKEQLESEITKALFAVPEGGQFIRGTLNDLLRIRQFQQNIDPYQSEFISSQARNNETEISLNPSSIVIYSGSNGYLNWKEDFLYKNSVIILDRVEPQFELAAEEVNNRYIQSNRITSSELDLGIMPGGIELLYWEEER
ncbi:hypothetical protein [Paenibacillus ehimensis]|uniref:hypothetical protein n=1 Tax=Paenibacillus ehimensis TaxID=79264 RepID=UPI00126926A9|nr:hypothetical protein [Paenibacillus ehimensis]